MPIVGDVLAERYRIEGVLGAGGMASVYRATDLRLDRQVAVKVLLPNLARDASLAERFDREARMLAAVAHPHVAAIFDVDPGDAESGREPFYVMELCEGGSLADLIDAGGPIDPADLVPTISAIAEGLAELHRRGLVHRDVKPANILFAGGRPKLADFGLTRTDGATDLTTLTSPGTTVGTPAYLAPELMAGGPPTVASDVYALAVTTFEGLTGRQPKPAETPTEMVAAQSMLAPAVSDLEPGLGTRFDAPVASGLAIAQEERPAPSDFAAALDAAVGGRLVEERDESPVDQLAETLVGIPTAAPAIRRGEPSPTPQAVLVGATEGPESVLAPGGYEPRVEVDAARARPAAWLRGLPAAGLVAFIIAIVVLAVTGWPVAGPGTSPTPGSASASAAPPTGNPTGPNAAEPALNALDAVVAAIDQARGGRDGLTGRDANDLQALAAAIEQALRNGDMAAARTAAASLAERVGELDDELDDVRGEALRDAIDDLRSAIEAA